MGSRVLPLVLAAGALFADAVGLHHAALYLVLLGVVGAAAAAFVGVGDALEGKGTWLRAGSAVLALALLVLGSAVRTNAPAGAHVPTLAISSTVAALLVYALPLVAWLLEPLAPKPRPANAQRSFG